MAQKSFLVKVNIHIKKVSCPGVWLCTNGNVSLQMCMFNSYVQTDILRPVFPIKINQHFTFHKDFDKGRLNDLQNRLSKEWFYVEFIQWQTPDDGCVLATFRTTLDELLYPTSKFGQYGGVDMELLMDTTKLFPGTLSPKLLIKTKTTIEETMFTLPRSEPVTKIVLSSQLSKRNSHTRRVCHSLMYNKAQKCWTDLGDTTKCKCDNIDDLRRTSWKPAFETTTNGHLNSSLGQVFRQNTVTSEDSHKPNKVHHQLYCPTCHEYKDHFSSQYKAGPCGCCESNVNDERRLVVDVNLESARALGRRLHDRLTECLCTNANALRSACNRFVDFD
ncbi:spermatogenesis-associated protein 6 isoform X2 [Aethina tumida]|uniref:spermatogenesis-associated protein 6 isoform X2 n=1 Tax=Aethina tumida TaxID=116153 RepID=UPI00214783D4|nr:spermatogenesis-associated protein 6 isoform X2 [Aethina tumida]